HMTRRVFGVPLTTCSATQSSTPPQGGDIMVELEQQVDSDGTWAVIKVRDQGVGIPVADQAHIIERFHRAGNVAGHIVRTVLGLPASGAPGTGGGSSEEVSLTHFIWVGGGQGVVPREVVPAYEQAHPNVHIELYEGIGYGITSEFRWLLLARSTGWAEQADHP